MEESHNFKLWYFFLHYGLEGSTGTELDEEEKSLFVFLVSVVAHDVGMLQFGQFCHDCDLPLMFRNLIKHLFLHELDGNYAIFWEMVAFEDDSVVALAELFGAIDIEVGVDCLHALHCLNWRYDYQIKYHLSPYYTIHQRNYYCIRFIKKINKTGIFFNVQFSTVLIFFLLFLLLCTKIVRKTRNTVLITSSCLLILIKTQVHCFWEIYTQLQTYSSWNLITSRPSSLRLVVSNTYKYPRNKPTLYFLFWTWRIKKYSRILSFPIKLSSTVVFIWCRSKERSSFGALRCRHLQSNYIVIQSATLVIAYYMKKHELLYNQALNHVKRIRPNVNPGAGY